ncbi:hypothetical protein [Endozoicomonas sp. SESOKO1]|uniref:hypothetical protein n=1 Tax=Endozoicomonas sp. SESOKO1 TaxID=2828742 RepID=UPI00214938D0|nr:hypothetical protein [Endozoicomonas sp. SESOKO1]
MIAGNLTNPKREYLFLCGIIDSRLENLFIEAEELTDEQIQEIKERSKSFFKSLETMQRSLALPRSKTRSPQSAINR